MTRESSSNNGSNGFGELVDTACRDFERRFLADANFRIENLLDEAERYFAEFDTEPRRAAAKQRVVAELIFVEMDMRRAASQLIDATEYQDRFPDFGPAIEASLNRLLRMHPDFHETCSLATIGTDCELGDGGLRPAIRLDQQRQADIPRELGPYREISQIKLADTELFAVPRTAAMAGSLR